MIIKYEKEEKIKVNGSYIYGELRSIHKEGFPYFFYPNWETMSARMDGPLSGNHLQFLIEELQELQELKDNIDASKVVSELIE